MTLQDNNWIFLVFFSYLVPSQDPPVGEMNNRMDIATEIFRVAE